LPTRSSQIGDSHSNDGCASGSNLRFFVPTVG
jgi:hypothetical protein